MNPPAIEIAVHLKDTYGNTPIGKVRTHNEGMLAKATIPMPENMFIGTPPKAEQLCHLLAAAPELFKAIEAVLTHYDDRRESMSITELKLYEAMEAAITKANGL